MNNLKNDKSQAFYEVKSKLNFIELFREYYPDVELKHTGIGSLIGCSPFREDKTPSLQIDKEHAYDHGTKEKLDIIDLYERTFGVNRETAIKNLSKRAGLDRKPSKKGKIVKMYDYTDENGELLYQKVRYEPKSFSQRRPDPDQPGKWITKEVFKHINHVPYRLPELISSDINSPVVITEGEKDSDSAISVGFASTTLGSKGDASKYFSDSKIQKYFTGRIVWLIADKDIPDKSCEPDEKRKIRAGGYKEFKKVAQALAPICKELRLFLLPGQAIKDLTDFINVHGDQSKQLVEKAAARTPIYVNRVKPEPATDKPEKVKSKKPKDPSPAQLLYQCFQDLGWKLFFDQSAEPWASVKINDHYENVAVGSRRFRRLLRTKYWASHGNGVAALTIEQVMDVELGKIEYTQPPFPLHVRMAWNATKDKILIDSGRPDWSIYEIGPDGWTITQTDQSPFKRARKTAAYSCSPDTPRATWDNLFEFLRVTNDHQKTIIKMWLCLALFPGTARPGFVINGPAETGKTTIAKRLKALIDPATNDHPNKFSNEDDMIAPLANYAVSFLDNATNMTPEQSDLLCLSITGLDNEKRALFTDGDIHNTELMSTWIITGVNNPGKLSDFLSRVFLLETELIPEDQRIPDGKIDELAAKYTPGIQALIFDCMSAALKNINSTKSEKLHRLAQANLYSLAMAEKLKLGQEQITKVWSANRDEQQAEVSSGEILTELIPEWLKKNGNMWEGTPSEHHKAMFENLEIEKRSYKKSFPVSAVHLTRRLNTIIANLAEKKIRIINKRGSTRIRQIFNTETFKDENPFEPKKVEEEKVPDPKNVLRPPQFNREQPVQSTLSDQDATSCNKCNHYQGNNSCGYSDGLVDPENCPMTQDTAQDIPW